MKLRKEFTRDGEAVQVTAEHVDGDRWRVRVGDAVHEFSARPGPGGALLLSRLDDGAAATATAIAFGAPAGKQFMVRVDGRTHTLAPPSGRGAGAGGGGDGTLIAPMTGTVLQVQCAPGDEVTADQTLVVLSAMKMEHKLSAGIDGVVESVATATGGTVEQGVVLVTVKPATDTTKGRDA